MPGKRSTMYHWFGGKYGNEKLCATLGAIVVFVVHFKRTDDNVAMIEGVVLPSEVSVVKAR